MHLSQNVRKKAYGSTEAFVADVKWIVHNCIIYNGSMLILCLQALIWRMALDDADDTVILLALRWLAF